MQPSHCDWGFTMERAPNYTSPSSSSHIEHTRAGRHAVIDGRDIPVPVGLFEADGLQIPRVSTNNISTMDHQQTFLQLHGPRDHCPQMIPEIFHSQKATPRHMPSNTPPSARSQNRNPKTAINDILPYCTSGTPLTQDQVIALSDIAGNLKEVMILALNAKLEDGAAKILVNAIGQEAAKGIVEFFSDEFEMGSV